MDEEIELTITEQAIIDLELQQACPRALFEQYEPVAANDEYPEYENLYGMPA